MTIGLGIRPLEEAISDALLRRDDVVGQLADREGRTCAAIVRIVRLTPLPCDSFESPKMRRGRCEVWRYIICL
jgi:hypothetical protein